MQELRLTPKQFGLIGASSSLLFSLSAVVTGFVVNRVKTRWVLLAMGFVWALTQFPMLGPAGLATIVASRVALGAGEGPVYPVALPFILPLENAQRQGRNCATSSTVLCCIGFDPRSEVSEIHLAGEHSASRSRKSLL
jgi:MFS family permease